MQDGSRTDLPGAPSSRSFRVLVVAADEHVGEPVRRELSELPDGQSADVRVVVPALADTAFQHAAGDVDEGLERAQRQLTESLEEVRSAGADGEGRVGDPDPIMAIEDSLREFPADEIVIVTHPEGDARWLEDDLFERAKERFEPPIRHFVVEDGAAAAQGERGPGVEPPAESDLDTESRNLPRFSRRDVGGIVVAVVGTLILVVIAAANPDETASGFDTDALHTMIAGLFGLINLAHVVGLVLFESVGYRGIAQRFFAGLSLYGTPAAIVVSLLLLLA